MESDESIQRGLELFERAQRFSSRRLGRALGLAWPPGSPRPPTRRTASLELNSLTSLLSEYQSMDDSLPPSSPSDGLASVDKLAVEKFSAAAQKAYNATLKTRDTHSLVVEELWRALLPAGENRPTKGLLQFERNCWAAREHGLGRTEAKRAALLREEIEHIGRGEGSLTEEKSVDQQCVVSKLVGRLDKLCDRSAASCTSVNPEAEYQKRKNAFNAMFAMGIRQTTTKNPQGDDRDREYLSDFVDSTFVHKKRRRRVSHSSAPVPAEGHKRFKTFAQLYDDCCCDDISS